MGRLGAFAVLRAQVRAAVRAKLQYRADFALDVLLEWFWTGAAVAPVVLVFRGRPTVAGIALGEALAVVGVFTVLTGVLETLIAPPLQRLVEQIRRGTLDFVLLAPRDAQLLLATGRVEPWRIANAAVGGALVAVGLRHAGHAPTGSEIAAASIALAAAVTYLFALFTAAASLAFWVVKADNLVYLFTSLFDAARWPRRIFRGAMKIVFTFILPFALMTSVPAEALLGTLTWPTLAGTVVGAVAAFAASRALLHGGIRSYSSGG